MTKLLRETVADNIRKLRVLNGLTQVELAKKARLTDVYISRVEQNAKNLTLDSVEQIAKALEVPVATLISAEKTAQPKGNTTTSKSLKHAIKVLEAYIEAIESKNV